MTKVSRKALKVAGVAVLALFVASCSNKGSVTGTGDGGTTPILVESVTVNPDTVSIGTSSTVTARVVYDNVSQSGAPGVSVTFSVSGVNGTFTPGTDTTDASGYAAATFTPQTTGSGTITATAQGAADPGTAAIVVEQQQPEDYPGSVSLNASPTSLIAGSGETSSIVATVLSTSNGNVANGTPVVFVAGDGFVDNNLNGVFDVGVDSLTFDLNGNGQWDANGSISPSSTGTSSNIATATYTATASSIAGSVYIRATAGDTSTNVASNTVMITLTDSTGGGAGTISLSIVPQTMYANNQDSALVTVSATDENGAPVPDGTVVTLVAGERFIDIDSNGVYTAGIDSLYDANGNGDWDAAGAIQQTITTTGGSASTYFYAGSVAGIFYVTATIDLGTVFLQTDRMFTLESSTVVASIELVAGSDHLQVQGTGGTETTIIQAFCYDVYGNSVPSGLDIVFEILNGPGGGENLNGQGYGPITDETSSAGIAEVSLSSGTASGTVQLWAYWINGQTGDTTYSVVQEVEISSGPPALLVIAINADDVNQLALGIQGVEYSVSAVCDDVYGNPVPDGTVIYFGMVGTDYTEAFVQSPRTTTDGTATTTMTTTGLVGPQTPGILEVLCETAGGTLADSTYAFASGVPTTLTWYAVPTSLNADGEDQFEVVVDVFDVNGNYVTAGFTIDFDAIFGDIDDAETEYPYAYGRAFATSVYTSAGAFDQDYSYSIPDDGIEATETITAWAFSAPAINTSFPLYSTFASVDNSSVTVPDPIIRGVMVPIPFEIRDLWDNVLSGHDLSFSVTYGSVNASASTDDFGIAIARYTPPADTTISADVLQALDTDPTYGGIELVVPLTITDP
jgi:hypothetical protein